jgi:hypothetical protein
VLTAAYHWAVLQLLCGSVSCTVKRIPSEVKFFIFVIIVMAYLFSLVYVVTVVYRGGSCFYFVSV